MVIFPKLATGTGRLVHRDRNTPRSVVSLFEFSPRGTRWANNRTESHEGPIKTPKQLVLTVVLSFALIIAVIVLLVTFVGAGKKVSAGTDVMSEIETAARIEKVGGIASIQDAGGGALRTGEEMFKAICSGCHATGVSSALKFGDAAAWGPRIKTGYDALLNSA